MATTSGNTDAAVAHPELLERLEQEPFRFHFFQMVRLLEQLHQEYAPVGRMTSPRKEAVRFHAPPAFVFPASEVSDYAAEDDGNQANVTVSFMGLNTINGPMPRVYTEALLGAAREKDYAAQDFLDIFNHRLLSLFYRSWRRYRLLLAAERNGDVEDDLVRRLYDLVGLGTAGLRNRMEIRDENALYYSGLLTAQVRSVEGLRQILESYFAVSVEIRQFSGAWVRLAPGQQTVLDEGRSMSERLGAGVVLGDEVWEQEGAVTVRLGPMKLERYREFLPGSRGQAELAAWLRLYSRRAFLFAVQLVLESHEVPQTALQKGNRLGYESWLKAKPMRRDPDETGYIVQ
ncbi:type VI secretion system baseplate subunit TssG [Silvibacterium acidisoli]|uniref:type VI secretion system baseplate subunit TssG n=1 Tax=Acidobacteriaceae bacterium ZG23-2 TaxID=2883246 RepID=UPI00406D2D6C